VGRVRRRTAGRPRHRAARPVPGPRARRGVRPPVGRARPPHLRAAGGLRVTGDAAARLAAIWCRERDRIHAALARAEGLGRGLRARPFEFVLCHADIHAGNVLVTPGEDRTVHLVDWDGPLVAPRERDLLFVVGSTIARTVEPREEALFFAGYGPVEIDPAAIVYYRYERFVQDLGEIGKSVFLDPALSEAMRHAEVDVAAAYLAPGGFLDRAEVVDRHGR
jgi:spectinomycin phosphotransferase